MEDKFNKIIKLIDENKTHPNFGKLWKQYLLIKYNKLEKLLTQCEEIFSNEIPTTSDLTEENILTFYLLNHS